MPQTNEAFKRHFDAQDKTYDDYLTGKRLWHRLYNHMFWQEADSSASVRTVLSYLPKNFSGRLLDVPAGTGVFTAERYKTLSDAHIDCLDYSSTMLDRYRARIDNRLYPQFHFLEGDVGDLPFADNTFDAVLSMNGIHCFPDKERALKELHRVLKPGGLFIGCTYLKTIQKRSDFFVQHIYVPMGFFIPPFQTPQIFEKQLARGFHIQKFVNKGAFGCFRCYKK